MASAGALCVTSRSEYPGRTASPATDAPCWPGPDSTIAAPPAHEGSHWTQRAAGRSTAQRSRPTGGHSRTAERRPKPQTVGQSQPRGQRFREVAAALPYECERLPSATLPDPLASLVGTAIRDTASAVLEEVADALPEMTRTGRRASAPDVDQLPSAIHRSRSRTSGHGSITLRPQPLATPTLDPGPSSDKQHSRAGKAQRRLQAKGAARRG